MKVDLSAILGLSSGHFGFYRWCGIAGGEHVPLAPLGWYFSWNNREIILIIDLMEKIFSRRKKIFFLFKLKIALTRPKMKILRESWGFTFHIFWFLYFFPGALGGHPPKKIKIHQKLSKTLISKVIKFQNVLIKGRRHNLKKGKFGDNVPNRLPPPPIGYFRLFWISDLFEKCWPPSRINFRHFWVWKHIDSGRPPRLTS